MSSGQQAARGPVATTPNSDRSRPIPRPNGLARDAQCDYAFDRGTMAPPWTQPAGQMGRKRALPWSYSIRRIYRISKTMVTTIYPELARHLSSIGLGGVSHLVYKKGGGGVGRTIQQSNTTKYYSQWREPRAARSRAREWLRGRYVKSARSITGRAARPRARSSSALNSRPPWPAKPIPGTYVRYQGYVPRLGCSTQ